MPDSALTLTAATALAGVMLLAALVPSVSVLTVSTRSAALGLKHGIFTTAGIVTGDVLFILIALYGLSALSNWLGNDFSLIKYLGGGYLIWLGIQLLRARPTATGSRPLSSVTSSFSAGLLITLADQKAIIFYFGLFPAFLDLERLVMTDTILIITLAVLAVGGPKLFYALMASRAAGFFKSQPASRMLNLVAGSVMLTIGVLLILKIL